MLTLVESSQKHKNEPYFISLNEQYGLTLSESARINVYSNAQLLNIIKESAQAAAAKIASRAGAIIMDKKAVDGGVNSDSDLFVINQSNDTLQLDVSLAGSAWSNDLKRLIQQENSKSNIINVEAVPLQLDYFGAGLCKAVGETTLLTPKGVLIAEAERRANPSLNPINTFFKNDTHFYQLGVSTGYFEPNALVQLLDVITQQVNTNRLEAGLGASIADKLYKSYKTFESSRQTKDEWLANIIWQGQNIGHVSADENRASVSAHLNNIELAPYFNAGLKSASSPNSNLVQQIISEHGNDSAFDVVDALNQEIYALGNLTLTPNNTTSREPDVKGISISEATKEESIYEGLVYGITRPSLYSGGKSVLLAPEEVEDANQSDILLAGNQPKTTVHLRQYKNGHYGIHNSADKDVKTHLLKMPGEHIGKSASLGGREWLSMSLAKDMGVDVPSFALVDLNKTTDEYVNPDEVDDFDSEWNLGTLKTKKALTAGGLTIGKLHVPEDELLNDFEKNAGNVIEPPGYIIELFSLPEKTEVNTQRYCPIDFCTLMGLESNERFKGSMETASQCLRQFSTNFESDKKRFMERFLCSWMIGDGDLHLKNLSMLVEHNSSFVNCELSPAYDILSLAGLSGYYANTILPVNGTQEPTVDDFAFVGEHYLDIPPDDTKMMAKRMAQKCLKSIGQFRGTQDLSAPSVFSSLPRAIKQHNSTNTALIQMCAGIELSLSFKGLLPEKLSSTIQERVKTEQPSVYKESEMLFKGGDNDLVEETESTLRRQA